MKLWRAWAVLLMAVAAIGCRAEDRSVGAPGSPGLVQLNNDLGGTPVKPTVVGIQNRLVLVDGAPGVMLTDGGTWYVGPVTDAGISPGLNGQVLFSSDASGVPTTQWIYPYGDIDASTTDAGLLTVTGIQGHPIPPPSGIGTVPLYGADGGAAITWGNPVGAMTASVGDVSFQLDGSVLVNNVDSITPLDGSAPLSGAIVSTSDGGAARIDLSGAPATSGDIHSGLTLGMYTPSITSPADGTGGSTTNTTLNVGADSAGHNAYATNLYNVEELSGWTHYGGGSGPGYGITYLHNGYIYGDGTQAGIDLTNASAGYFAAAAPNGLEAFGVNADALDIYGARLCPGASCPTSTYQLNIAQKLASAVFFGTATHSPPVEAYNGFYAPIFDQKNSNTTLSFATSNASLVNEGGGFSAFVHKIFPTSANGSYIAFAPGSQTGGAVTPAVVFNNAGTGGKAAAYVAGTGGSGAMFDTNGNWSVIGDTAAHITTLSGTGGTGANGTVYFQLQSSSGTPTGTAFGLPLLGLNSIPLTVHDASLTLAASGTTTVTAAQSANPSLTIAAVTLTGNATLAFGNVGGAVGTSSAIYDVDVSQVVTNGYTLTFANGSASVALRPSEVLYESVVHVKCNTNAISLTRSFPAWHPVTVTSSLSYTTHTSYVIVWGCGGGDAGLSGANGGLSTGVTAPGGGGGGGARGHVIPIPTATGETITFLVGSGGTPFSVPTPSTANIGGTNVAIWPSASSGYNGPSTNQFGGFGNSCNVPGTGAACGVGPYLVQSHGDGDGGNGGGTFALVGSPVYSASNNGMDNVAYGANAYTGGFGAADGSPSGGYNGGGGGGGGGAGCNGPGGPGGAGGNGSATGGTNGSSPASGPAANSGAGGGGGGGGGSAPTGAGNGGGGANGASGILIVSEYYRRAPRFADEARRMKPANDNALRLAENM